jgi:hypothetical protein
MIHAARTSNYTHPCVSSCVPSGANSSCTLCRNPPHHIGELCVSANCRHSRVGRWAKRTHCAYRSAQQSYYWDSLQAAYGRPWNIKKTVFHEINRCINNQNYQKYINCPTQFEFSIAFGFIPLHVLKELHCRCRKSPLTWSPQIFVSIILCYHSNTDQQVCVCGFWDVLALSDCANLSTRKCMKYLNQCGM